MTGAALGIAFAASPSAQSPVPSAQRVRRSQEAAVRQRIATTWIDIRYWRPVARGRNLFGELVPWGHVWSPSADSATMFTISTPLRVEGQVLPRGSYSIWVMPDSAGPWTVIFSRANPVFHLPYPGEDRDQLRIRVTPGQATHMEALAWYFPSVDAREATLTLHWGTTALPIRIAVDP